MAACASFEAWYCFIFAVAEIRRAGRDTNSRCADTISHGNACSGSFSTKISGVSAPSASPRADISQRPIHECTLSLFYPPGAAGLARRRSVPGLGRSRTGPVGRQRHRLRDRRRLDAEGTRLLALGPEHVDGRVKLRAAVKEVDRERPKHVGREAAVAVREKASSAAPERPRSRARPPMLAFLLRPASTWRMTSAPESSLLLITCSSSA